MNPGLISVVYGIKVALNRNQKDRPRDRQFRFKLKTCGYGAYCKRMNSKKTHNCLMFDYQFDLSSPEKNRIRYSITHTQHPIQLK